MMKYLDPTDPKVQTWAGALIAVLSAIAQGTIQFPLGIPAYAAEIMKSWDGFIVSIWLIAVPILFGVSKGAGPWASAPPKQEPKP